MKRFYTDVSVTQGADGWSVALDGRPVRTPARALLALPNEALGQAVADEWRAQGDEILLESMPMTGLSNAAIDQIAPRRASFAQGVAAYGESDLLCYRADAPQTLVDRQAAAWDPLLDWARGRYDVTLRVTQGIIHVAQPPETLVRLGAAVAALDPFTLAGLSTLVSLTGSLVCGLALVEGAQDPDIIWAASELDEMWQVERWGEDAEAAARRARRHQEFAMSWAFCAMARE
ncbi:ATP12 family protein [Sphingobium sp. AN641]|uniref:ATP12 family chaperone protein n=1 Tax=Sphingobium sp. AN641 TaxID=3133443 RepID=UPI0030BF023B